MIYRIGIGDILITKMIFDTYGMYEKFKIYKTFISQYREGSSEYLEFIKKLSETLFGSDWYEITENYEQVFNNSHYKLKHFDLSGYFELKNQFTEPYVVFHTKIRLDSERRTFLQQEKEFKQFLQNLNTHVKIVLLGERNLSVNLETIEHNHTTIYEHLLVLKNNNNVLDLTEETLNNSPDWNIFVRDLCIINNAKLNIGIGFGGNMVICSAFSDKNCFYTANLEHPFLKSANKFVEQNFCNFLNKIKKELNDG